MFDYEKLGAEIGKLVNEKQKAYGDSFSKSGEIMAILYPQGIPIEKLDDSLTIVRILDKIFRIATDRDALGESPYRDIAGYALLGAQRTIKNKGDNHLMKCKNKAKHCILFTRRQGLKKYLCEKHYHDFMVIVDEPFMVFELEANGKSLEIPYQSCSVSIEDGPMKNHNQESSNPII